MWTGTCNSCGRCCVADYLVPEKGQVFQFRCSYLLVSDKLGKPGATYCAVWEAKYDGMPTTMVAAEGYTYPSRCLASYPRPHDAVPPECSLTFQPDELVQIQPHWTLGYLPELKET